MKKTKTYTEMNLAELREATKEYDKPFVALEQSRPLSAAGRKLLKEAAKRGVGRPPVGNGSRKIHITIESGLLREADHLAKRQKIGRSELIARGLSLMLGRKAG